MYVLKHVRFECKINFNISNLEVREKSGQTNNFPRTPSMPGSDRVIRGWCIIIVKNSSN